MSAVEVGRSSPPEHFGDLEEIDALRDGTRVRIRRVRPDDLAGLEAFVARLSPDSVESRYFSPVSASVATREMLGTGKEPGRVAVVMETVGGTSPRIVGHAEYVRDPNGRPVAEAAFVIADAFQGKGAGTLLLWHLARTARSEGIRTLEAITLRVNAAMLGVCFDAGYPCEVSVEDESARIALDISSERHTALCMLPKARSPTSF